MFNKIKRRKTRTTKIGSLKIGGNQPISVQSMTNCDVKDTELTIRQLKRLEAAGCDLVRIAFPDIESCQQIPKIKDKVGIPIMADIHFDHLIALEAIKYHIDGIRINPGNIKKESLVLRVIEEAQKNQIMIRFGINAGSLDKKIIQKYHKPSVEAMIEETDRLVSFLDKISYHNIVLSIKSSNVMDTIKANEIVSKKYNYPLHIGITEAGFGHTGIIKSAIGIGILLYQGIGDTLRVSLSGDPEQEVLAGYDILRSLSIRKRGINIISCPTCGRCQVDVYRIAEEIKNNLQDIHYPFTIAVMGCIVNGPGEAKISDIGIAFNKKEAILYKEGRLLKRYTDIDKAIQEVIKITRSIEKK